MARDYYDWQWWDETSWDERRDDLNRIGGRRPVGRPDC